MITYYVGASADGFIAGPNDEMGFLDQVEHVPDQDYGYQAFYDSIEVCVWGRTTYDWVMNQDVAFPYPDKQNWILTRSRVEQGAHQEVFATYDKAQWELATAEKSIWLVGGGVVASLFLADELIDRLILTVIPVSLGEGKELFTGGLDAGQWPLEERREWPNGVTQDVRLFKR